MRISYLFSFSIIVLIRTFSQVFYKTEVKWVTPEEQIDWRSLRVLVMLNHTSLYEPLFMSSVSLYRLWRAMKRTVIPVADVTMQRPIAGLFFRWLIPGVVSITRKRDDTWSEFLGKIGPDSLVALFPEGRMKRLDGFDKNGKPMSVKGGIADILASIDSGKVLIAYSGGLHHVQAPGQMFPNLFQTIRVAFEQLDVQAYKASLQKDNQEFKQAVIQDLEARMKKHCPEA
jgi:hypothetical protein